MRNKKGNITIFIVFFFVAIVIIMISAFVAPLGVRINTEMYKAGENILSISNKSIQDIQNVEVRNSLTNITSAALGATETNIEVNNALFQYGWVLVLGLGALIAFLFTRSLVEVGGGGFI